MKKLIPILGILITTTTWATETITKVGCSSLDDGGSSKLVIELEHVDHADGRPTFDVTYFSESSSVAWICTSDEGELPDGMVEMISCRVGFAAPPIRVDISSADGVLNMGQLTFKGKKTNLYCHATFASDGAE